jgi:hypothetical protein
MTFRRYLRCPFVDKSGTGRRALLHKVLDENRAELIERCGGKVARRLASNDTPQEMEHVIPMSWSN